MKPMELVSLRCITSRIEEKKTFYACYQLGPFSIGQSLTVATTLRRSLLTELQGLAILEVEFQGVTHEYSVLPGIRESILEILLNLKQLVFTSNHRITRPVYGYLKFYGPGIVKAKSFQLPAYIQCVDPEQYIATLSYNGFLNLKCVITQGTGYCHNYPQTFQKDALKKKFLKHSKTRSNLAEKTFFSLKENQKFFQLVSKIQSKQIDEKNKNSFQKKHIDETSRKSIDFKKNNIILPLDTIFVPVKKVNFSIEIDEKLQQPKEFIVFEIWTNGSLHPRQALHDATKKLLFLLYPIQKAISLNRMKKFLPFFEKKKNCKNLEKSKIPSKKIVRTAKQPMASLPVFVKTATSLQETLRLSKKHSVFRKVQSLRKLKNNSFFFKKKRKLILTKLSQNF